MIFLFGLTPLIIYHVRLLKDARTETIPQALIDSIYYFGFLITLSTLAIAVIRLSFQNNTNESLLSNIAIQFGLGLIATGYALAARIHLMALQGTLEEKDLDKILDKYHDRLSDSIIKTQLVTEEMERFALALQAKNNEYLDETFNSFKASFKKICNSHEQSINNITDVTLSSISKISEALKGFSLENEVSLLKTDMRILGGSLSNMSGRITSMLEKVESIDVPIKNTSTILTHLNSNLIAASSNFESYYKYTALMSSNFGKVSESLNLVTNSTIAFEESISSLRKIFDGKFVTRLSNINDQITKIIASSESVVPLMSTFIESIKSTEKASSLLNTEISAIAELFDSYKMLTEKMGVMTENMNKIIDKCQITIDKYENSNEIVEKRIQLLSSGLEEELRKTEAVVSIISTNFVKMVDFIITETKNNDQK